jgi:hypothetical protein
MVRLVNLAEREGFGKPGGIDSTEVIDPTIRSMGTNRGVGDFIAQKPAQVFGGYHLVDMSWT